MRFIILVSFFTSIVSGKIQNEKKSFSAIDSFDDKQYLITNTHVGYFKIGGKWREIAEKDYNFNFIQGYGTCIDGGCDGGFDLGQNLELNSHNFVSNQAITVGAKRYKNFQTVADSNKYKNKDDVFFISSNNSSGFYFKDAVHYMIVYSDAFKTKEHIGVGTTLEVMEQKFGKLNFNIGWIEEDWNAVSFSVKGYPNISFILNPEDFKENWEKYNLLQDANNLTLSEFKKNTTIKRLIVF
jgi:hypothetical protein